MNERYITFLNPNRAYCDCELFNVFAHESRETVLATLLNSSLQFLISETESRLGLGLGALKKQVYELKNMMMINAFKITRAQNRKAENILDKLTKRPMGSVFEEIGANYPEEVSLDGVKPDRRKLDKIVMEEILGLSEKEQLEVYRAVVDLVKSRIERAKSVKKKTKKGKFDISALADDILQETKINELKKFPDEYVSAGDFTEMPVPEGGQVEIRSDLFHGVHVKVGEEIIKCKNYDEASYIKYAILNGNSVVRIPSDEDVLKKATKEYGKLLSEIRTTAEKTLNEFVPDKKVKEQVRREIIRKIFTRNKRG